jgi:hypothetical protein
MHHVVADDALAIMREYIDALAPGSYVVLSHFVDPETPERSPIAHRIEDILVNGPMGPGRFRARAETMAILDPRRCAHSIQQCRRAGHQRSHKRTTPDIGFPSNYSVEQMVHPATVKPRTPRGSESKQK